MTILGKFKKQPAEVLDYDISYVDFFSTRTDDAASIVVTSEAGITVVSQVLAAKVCKVVLSGGTSGVTYKITARMTTTSVPAIVKEDEFRVAVLEI